MPGATRRRGGHGGGGHGQQGHGRQPVPAQEAGRPQPQTTIEPPGGPFIRHSQPGRMQEYNKSAVAFGSSITDPLVSVPGYLSRMRLRVEGAGGAGGSAVAADDAPYNVFANVIFRDAFGTPLFVGPGYEILKLVPKYGGQFGLNALSDPSNLPSFSAVDADGNFVFQSALPLEVSKGIGLVSMANASLLPTLQFSLNASGAFFGTPPVTTLPTMNVVTEADMYWLPEGGAIEPPGLGTTCQWIYAQANPSIGSQSSVSVSLPRMGGFITTLIFILRDSTGARIDAWPDELRILVDGVPLIDSQIDTVFDDMQMAHAGADVNAWTRDTGVIAVTRKTSMSQMVLGLQDTGESYLSTNPGTLIQVQGSPWGTISNAPATLSVMVGQVIPAQSLVYGLPEL